MTEDIWKKFYIKYVYGDHQKYRDWKRSMKHKNAGKPFRPTTGEEGMAFMAANCNVCEHKGSCIVVNVKSPKEWIYNDRGDPVCTEFVGG